MNGSFNLLFLASWYPSRIHPQLGNFIRRHAEAVSQQHRVCVVAAIEAGFRDIEIKEEEKLFEIKIYYQKKLPLWSYYRALKKGIRLANQYCGSFDLCHVHVAFPAGLGALGLQTPYLISEHFSGYHPLRKFRWNMGQKYWSKRILRKAQVLLPVSEFLKEGMQSFTPKAHYKVVPNVVDEKLFYPESYQSNCFTFLHISTLEEGSKNITGLLEGASLLHRQGRSFLLKIGGDGDLEVLRNKINEAGLPYEKVEIVPEKPIKGIAALMRQCHSLLMFSHFETQSCTILEALCSGRPVVSSAVGGIPEIVDKSNGILVKPNQPEALARGMAQMMDSYAGFDQSEIATRAHSRYGYQAVSQQLSDVYLSVLK